LGTEFIIFEPDQNLIFLDLLALLYPDPRHAASDFGVHVDSVVSDDVTSGGESGVVDVVAYRGGAGHIHLGNSGGAEAERGENQRQQCHTGDPSNNVPAIP
jgi:hypothetical protein